MKSTKKILLFLIIFLLGISSWFVSIWWTFLNSPLIVNGGESRTFVFAEGDSVKRAAYSLQRQNLLKHPMFFVLYVRLKNADHNLQAGEYLIESGITPRELVQKMVKGDVVQHSFTVVEGWTFSKMISALNENPNVKHTIQDLSPKEIMERIGASGVMPEGRFAADTYLFRGKSDDIDILITAYNLMKKRLDNAWNNRANDLPYKCPYDALIVASLIEKETASVEEKPIIAGVILRRLKKGMLLQIDPTVIYGLGERYDGKLSRKDLAIDTSYNTYTRKGFPPTPIAMSSESSIEAALHPADGTALYYVSKGDGTHEFSDTHKDQIKAINKYIRK